VFPILRELRQLRRVARSSRKRSSLFIDIPSGVDFTALFAEQWNESLCGSTAARHLIILRQQEALLKSLSAQKTGLFLCENQPWEAAFTYAWHKHGHDKNGKWVLGNPGSEIVATEHGMKFFVDVEKGQKTGFFENGIYIRLLHNLLDLYPDLAVRDDRANIFRLLAGADGEIARGAFMWASARSGGLRGWDR
jgi:hypothetical protein